MSSFLCFICHSTVNSDTNEEIREKYREVIGINLCPDSHLCCICCHVLHKLWLFKSVCLKRSLEYPVLFTEKGTLNLQKNDTEIHILCPDDGCEYQKGHINIKSYHFNDNTFNRDAHRDNDSENNHYVELEEDRNDFDDYFKPDKYPSYEAEAEQTAMTPVETEISEMTYNHSQSSIMDDENQDYNEDFDHQADLNELHVPSENLNNIKDFEELCNEREMDKYKERESSPKSAREKKVKEKKLTGKKQKFLRVVLSLEQQKAELEAMRKDKKYLEAEFKCYNCALGFLFKDSYQIHMMRHEESNGEHRCSICTLRFASPAVLRAHSAAHRERYTCVRCGCRVKNARHSCDNSDISTAACHLCAAMFRDSNGLQQHLKRFHKERTNNKIYSCNICGKNYNNQGAVRTHMIKHINRKFTCEHCHATFSSPYTLNAHKKKHTDENNEQHFCETCGLSYSTRKSLLAHRRKALVHQQTVFECPICGRVCPNAGALSSHVQVHSCDKRYACDICGTRYATRASLARHARSHVARPVAKTAVCHLCGTKFKGTNKLNRHLREVCEKAKLEEQLASYYEQAEHII